MDWPTAKRAPDLPDVPTIGQCVPDYAASGWYSVTAPSGTPVEVIAKLHDTINAGLADPMFSARLLAAGVAPQPMTTAELGAFIADEIANWAKVIRFAALKPEG